MSRKTEVPWLLDVNALIALIDAEHVHHDRMMEWFEHHLEQGWASCPITENGVVRVLSHRSYPNGRRAVADVILALRDLRMAKREFHRFWSDDVSLTDGTLFRVTHFVSHRQLTDVYLLGLVARRGGRLVSFDRSLAWQAIQDGSAELVELLA